MDLNALHTLAELWQARVAATPDSLAYLQNDLPRGDWSAVTWRTMGQEVDTLRRRLEDAALPHGSRVGILLKNGTHAVCVDQAAMASGLVPVPMHALDNPESIAYIMIDCSIQLLFVETLAQWHAIEVASHGKVPLPVQQVVVMDGQVCDGALNAGTCCSGYAAWKACPPSDAGPQARRAVDAEDLAAIVYTSGTTGRPKGVMLGHRNVMANVRAICQRLPIRSNDLFLSVLPMSHTFERTAGCYLPIASGAQVAFCREARQLEQDLKAVRPTVMIAVPRLLERLWLSFQARHEQDPSLSLRDLLGGRLRLVVSGGAALGSGLADSLQSQGVPILQGYGMTEASPVVAVNALEDNDPRSVGRALPGVEVCLSESRELWVRGPSVMRGYWRRDEDSRQVLQGDWLKTGDMADLIDGRIHIVGRFKEIIVTSTGEKVSPHDLEQAIALDPMFSQVFVFGEQRPFLGVILVLQAQAWRALTDQYGLDPDAPDSLRSPRIHEPVLERLKRLTQGFPFYARPRAAILALEAWTQENSLLTPTLKLKRNNLLQRFANEIEQAYQKPGSAPSPASAPTAAPGTSANR